MAYPLTETYKIQLYAGDEPRKETRIVMVDCPSDVETVRNYINKVVALQDECEKWQKKYWKLSGSKQLELTEEERKDYEEEKMRNGQLEKDRDKLTTDLANSQKDATNWKSVYELEKDKVKGLENDKTQLTTDLTNKNNEIKTILTKWKAKDLTELNTGIQNTVDKRKELENKISVLNLKIEVKDRELQEKDNTISQKDKTINSLQLKNEKLTKSYKKLINHLADARLLISHLQNDLQTEKQDKAHIQKELEDALAILNKPTAEMGTQTDLTAEQITQMEQDIQKHRDLLYQGAMEIDKLEKEITTLQSEIEDLKEQVKETKLNPTEERLMKISIFSFYTKEAYQEWIIFLNSGKMKEEVWDWSQLSKPFERLRNMMVINCQRFIELRDQEKKMEEETETRNQLQTKYDMEVRSKEELIKYLNIYRGQGCIDLRTLGYIYERDGVEKKTSEVSEELNRTFIEIIKQSIHPYSFIIYHTGKLPFVFPKDKLAEQRLIIKTTYPHDKKIIEVKRGDRLWKEQPTPDKLHTNQIFNPNYGTKDGHYYLDFISNDNIEIKVVD